MVKHGTGCRHCGGSLIRDGDEVKCLNCGQPVLSNYDMKRYYEQNKEAIRTDIRKIGPTAARKKWQIPSGTFSQLKGRWQVLEEQKPPEVRQQPTDNHLPRLPEFNDDWGENVQIRWLETWLYLVIRLKEEVK